MVRLLRSALAAVLLVLLSGCTERIDFEHDIPQRAKSIAVIETDKARASMEVPELRQQYKNYVRQKAPASKKSLTQLEKEKRDIEQKIAVIIRANSGSICPLCKKKFNVKPSARKHVAKKSSAKGKKNAQKKKKTVVASKKQQVQRPQEQQPASSQPQPQFQQPMPPQPQFNVPMQPQFQQPMPQPVPQPMPQTVMPQPMAPMVPGPAYSY